MTAMRTIFACETPWTKSDGFTLAGFSMQPFLVGLATFHGCRLLYRTFTTSAELHNLVSDEFPANRSDTNILYIGAHGRRGVLGTDLVTIRAGVLAKKVHKAVEGVWISACGVSASSAVNQFVSGGRAVWAGGYSDDVGWSKSALVDLAVLQAAVSRGPVTSVQAATRLFTDGLRPFNGKWKVGGDAMLSETLRIVARGTSPGRARPVDITDDIKRRLGW
jgi:hypothetical protein